MDHTEWIALLIVGLTAIFLIIRLFSSKKRRSCCSKGCSAVPKKNNRV